MLRLYRKDARRSVREFAEEIGVPPATLHRAERDSASIGAQTFVRILAWMLESPSRGQYKT